MKINTRLLFIAALFALVLPFIFTGNADAIKYNPDGAVLNGTTGLWELPDVFCAGVPASWNGTGDPGAAVRRNDLSLADHGAACDGTTAGLASDYIAFYAGNEAGCRAAGYTFRTGASYGCYALRATYVPEGATNWVTSYGTPEYRACLKCHNTTYMGADNYAGQVANYLNASHKNASRKIVAGKGLANVWIDTDGTEYFGIFPHVPGLKGSGGPVPQTDGPCGSDVGGICDIRRIDWVNGKIEDTTANASHVGLKNLPTGTYTDWYWEFGYYGEDPERGVYNAIAKSNGQPSAFMTGCFFCHGTGAVGSNALDTTKEPERSFPGISWDGTATYTPGSRPGKVNLKNQLVTRADRSTIPATYSYGAWDEFGVVCSSCHASSDGSHQNVAAAGKTIAWGSGAAIEGASINAVCGQCHVKGSSGNGSVSALAADQITLRKYVGTGHPNYHATDFLNSPHARFTGTYGQISSTASYGSAFLTNYGGCEGCHNPHGSVREPLHHLATGAAAPSEGIEATCATCHAAAQASTPAITSINHPTGDGTPMGTTLAPTDGCVICHMPSGRHLFRITLDTNYTTTQPTAFPVKADGTFTDAVWVDMKSACGQCHATVIPHFDATTKEAFAAAAAGMHDGSGLDCTACHTTVVAGTNHHAGGCASCHADGAPNGRERHDGVSNTAGDVLCTQCHGNGQVANAHPVVTGSPSSCQDCHNAGGYIPQAATCGTCHTTADQNKVDALVAFMHDGAPIAAFGATASGLSINVNAVASSCPSGTCEYSWSSTGGTVGSQTVSTGISYTAGGAKTIILTVTDPVTFGTATATKNVTLATPNTAPVAAFAAGSPSLTGWTASVTDNSTDVDDAGTVDANKLTGAAAIKVTWGDGTSSMCAKSGTVTHTYTSAGSRTVTLTATDNSGLKHTVTAPAPVVLAMGTVSGTVTPAQAMVKVQLVVDGVTKTAYTNTTGAYSIANVKPGTGRTMSATKTISGVPTTFATQTWVTTGVTGKVNSGANVVNFAP